MIVVPVLITNCHVSLNEKIGPDTAQTIIMINAAMNVTGFPAMLDVILENLVNNESLFPFIIVPVNTLGRLVFLTGLAGELVNHIQVQGVVFHLGTNIRNLCL